ncbi:hypothetical protein ACQ86N_27625 [Puia sp. P3]|uniref:hypothetical protein n=1 Tax=Puia sp. P3 TaxID=3423952 RepID=UPI003D679473
MFKEGLLRFYRSAKRPLLLLWWPQIILMTGCFLLPNYSDYVNSELKPRKIRGVVVSKSKEQTGCFGFIIFKQAGGVDTLRNIYYCTPPENGVWKYVLPGDSLIKDAGVLGINVIRGGVAVEIRVSDEGAGIGLDDKPHLCWWLGRLFWSYVKPIILCFAECLPCFVFFKVSIIVEGRRLLTIFE